MPKFIIGYLGNPPQPSTPEEGQVHMGKWKEWMDGLGDAVVMPPSPLKNNKIVTTTGVSDDTRNDGLTGFILVEAADIDAALAMAAADPYLDMAGGTLQVSEIMQMG